MKKWAPLKGYEKYYKISTEGEVLNISTNNILSTNIHSLGYHRLKLNVEGKRITKYLYSLLGTTFVENPNPELYDRLSFKDGNRLNYLPDNLYWTNIKEINGKNLIEFEPGTVINNFTVVGEGIPYIWKGKKQRRINCKCICGKIKAYHPSLVASKNIPNCCGCKKHNLSYHPLYKRFQGMKKRCYNPKAKSYGIYGGKGIKICKEWLEDFKTFYDWSMKNGFKEHLEIDRKNSDLGYNPSNCRWITRKENSINKKGLKLSYKKVKEIRKSNLSKEELCKKYNVSITTIVNVLKNKSWIE
mgnify:CR=1 FL=1